MTEVRFEPARRVNVPLLIGLAGESGSGKTYSALLLAKGLAKATGKKIAGIDSEAGRMLHYADMFSFDHASISAPFRPDTYLDAIKAAEKAGYGVIVIDSASHEHAGEGGLLDWHDQLVDQIVERKRAMAQKNGWAFDEWKENDKANMGAWIEPKMAHKRFVQHLLQVKAHIIMCFRAEPKIEMKKNDKGKMEIGPKESPVGAEGYVPVCEKGLPYEMTVSFLLRATHPGVPIPIKLQEQHRPYFNLKSTITEDSGAHLAEWAAGAPAEEKQMSLQNVLVAIRVAETIEHLQKLTPHVKRLVPEEQKQASEAAKARAQELKSKRQPDAHRAQR